MALFVKAFPFSLLFLFYFHNKSKILTNLKHKIITKHSNGTTFWQWIREFEHTSFCHGSRSSHAFLRLSYKSESGCLTDFIQARLENSIRKNFVQNIHDVQSIACIFSSKRSKYTRYPWNKTNYVSKELGLVLQPSNIQQNLKPMMFLYNVCCPSTKDVPLHYWIPASALTLLRLFLRSKYKLFYRILRWQYHLLNLPLQICVITNSKEYQFLTCMQTS